MLATLHRRMWGFVKRDLHDALAGDDGKEQSFASRLESYSNLT